MSLITDKNQVGLSSTASQNFTISAPADGTFRVSRGNIGATTSDVLNIDAIGYVTTPNGLGVGTSAANSERLAIQTLQSDPVYGANILSNGSFASGSTGWTVGAGWVVSGGQATSTGTGALSTTVTVVSGTPYQIDVGTWTGADMYFTAGTALVNAYIPSGQNSAAFTSNVTGSITISFTPISASSTSITNIAVKQIVSAALSCINFKDQSGNVTSQIRACKSTLNNTAFGLQALFYNTTGFYNTAFGTNALISNRTGYANTSVGYNSNGNNITGYGNTTVGYSTLSNNQYGWANTAIGLNALFTNTTGWGNTAIGISSLSNNTVGTNNVAVGNSALVSTYGNYNVGIGYGAGSNITTGSNNVIIGSYAGSAALANTIVIADGTGAQRIVSDLNGNMVFPNGIIYSKSPTLPAAITATKTLSIADLLNQMLEVTSATAVSLTLPTGTLTQAGVSPFMTANTSFDWDIINTGSAAGAVTIVAGATHTYKGSALVNIGTSARFRTQMQSTNTFGTFRLG